MKMKATSMSLFESIDILKRNMHMCLYMCVRMRARTHMCVSH